MLKFIKAGLFSPESILMVVLTAALVASGCSKLGGAQAVANGDTVSVKYKLTLDDGNVADSSADENPLKFVVGEGNMIKGFDEAVVGMKVSEEKSVTVPPEQAYGPRDTTMIRNFSRQGLPEGFVPEIGQMLQLRGPNGPVPAKIVSFTEDSLSLDLNHPLAGQNLNFAIKVVGIAKGAVAPTPAATQEK